METFDEAVYVFCCLLFDVCCLLFDVDLVVFVARNSMPKNNNNSTTRYLL